jgi:hypothetical protein
MSRHIAIVGARRRTDRETIDRLVAGLPADTVIVSGGARRRLHASAALPSRFSDPISMISTCSAKAR